MRQPVTSSCTRLQNRAIKAEWGWDWQLIGSQVSPDVLGGETAKGAHKKRPFKPDICCIAQKSVFAQETGFGSFIKGRFSFSPPPQVVLQPVLWSPVPATSPVTCPTLAVSNQQHPLSSPSFACLRLHIHVFYFPPAFSSKLPKALGTRSAHGLNKDGFVSLMRAHKRQAQRELDFLWGIRSPSGDSVSRSHSEWPVLARFSTSSVFILNL